MVRGAELEEALVPVLRGGERPQRETLTAAVARLMTALATLSDAEKAHVERIQSGELQPEPLAGDEPELLERVRRHPMLLWKAERRRRMVGSAGGLTGRDRRLAGRRGTVRFGEKGEA